MSAERDDEKFAQLADAIGPYLDRVVIVGGWAHRLFRLHPLPSGESPYNVDMNVELTPDQRAFVQKAIESGRFSREEEAVQEALALWERRERRRLEIIAMIDEADAFLARGEGRVFTKDSTPALVDEIKQRLRRRIAAERSATPR